MTTTAEISERDLEAFSRFLKHLPHGQDVDLVVLKAHLLVEEQVRSILAERVQNSEMLRKADLTCAQAIALAQSFFPTGHDPALWSALQKLNKLRNDIAHNVETKGKHDRIDAFVETFASHMKAHWQGQQLFEIALWLLFVEVSRLVQRPSAAILELIPRRQS